MVPFPLVAYVWISTIYTDTHLMMFWREVGKGKRKISPGVPGDLIWSGHLRVAIPPQVVGLPCKLYILNGHIKICIPLMIYDVGTELWGLGRVGIGLLIRQPTPHWRTYYTCSLTHRWELPVLRYHGIRGNYHYPILGVLFSVILHGFIRQNYHKNQSDRHPFPLIMVNYPTFLINSHIYIFRCIINIYFSSQSTRTMYRNKIEILQFLEFRFL